MAGKTFDDFAMVRLSARGLAFAGEAQTLRFGNAHSDYTFTGQKPQKVVRRGELPMFLAYTLPDGSPVFELVQDASAPAAGSAAVAAAVTTSAVAQAIPAPEVSHAE